MATQQFSAGSDLGSGDQYATKPDAAEKPSFLGKVKAKARKLKSKIKPGSGGTDDRSGDLDASSGSEDEAPLVSESTDHSERTSESASSILPQDNQFQKPSFGQSDYAREDSDFDADTKSKSFSFSSARPADKEIYRNDGPSGLEQAVPTNYSYYNSDSDLSGRSSNAPASQTQRDALSTFGNNSAPSGEVNSSFRSSNAPASQTQRDALSTFGNNSAPSREVNSSFGGEDSKMSSENDTVIPLEAVPPQDSGVGFKRSVKTEEPEDDVHSASLENDVGTNLSGISSNKTAGGDSGVGDYSQTSEPEVAKPIYSRAYEGLAAAAAGVGGAAAGLGQRFGVYKGTSAVDGTNNPAKEDIGGETVTDDDNAHSTAGDQTYTQKAYDTTVGFKDAVAEKLGVPAVPDNSSSYNPSSNQTWTQKAYDTTVGTKDAVVEKFGAASAPDTGSPYKPAGDLPQNAYDTTMGTKDAMAEKLGAATAADTGTTPGSNQTWTQKTYDATMGTKDALAEKVGVAAPQNGGKSTTPGGPPALSDRSQAAADHASNVVMQNMDPDHDKSLASSVTESISSLPGLLSSKLGFGAQSATSPTSGSSPASGLPVSDAAASTDLPSSDSTAAASPGIFDRVSGVASSLFSSGAKKPTTEAHQHPPSADMAE